MPRGQHKQKEGGHLFGLVFMAPQMPEQQIEFEVESSALDVPKPTGCCKYCAEETFLAHDLPEETMECSRYSDDTQRYLM